MYKDISSVLFTQSPYWNLYHTIICTRRRHNPKNLEKIGPHSVYLKTKWQKLPSVCLAPGCLLTPPIATPDRGRLFWEQCMPKPCSYVVALGQPAVEGLWRGRAGCGNEQSSPSHASLPPSADKPARKASDWLLGRILPQNGLGDPANLSESKC